MTNADGDPQATTLLVFSDFVWPWCYIGLVEVEQLRELYDLEVQFTPYLLDPTTPPEGKPRRQMTQPGDPPTAMEQRAAALGIAFTRGRTWSSNSHLALEAAEFAAEHGDSNTFHRRVFRAYFEELADIGDIELLVRLGTECGLPAADLREALATGRYRAGVDEELAWAQQVGVSAVPTFVLDGKLAIVGAQEASVFDEVLRTRLGRTPKPAPGR